MPGSALASVCQCQSLCQFFTRGFLTSGEALCIAFDKRDPLAIFQPSFCTCIFLICQCIVVIDWLNPYLNVNHRQSVCFTPPLKANNIISKSLTYNHGVCDNITYLSLVS